LDELTAFLLRIGLLPPASDGTAFVGAAVEDPPEDRSARRPPLDGPSAYSLEAL